MSNKRRNFSSSFKSKVALEALRGDLTLAELATNTLRNTGFIQHRQVTTWKRQAISGMQEVFSDNPISDKAKYEKQVKELLAKIGELLIEKDFLLKASGH